MSPPLALTSAARRWLPIVGLAAIVAAVIGHKAWLLHAADHTLHQDPDDYAALALGHGINFDFWVERFPERSVQYFQTTHPGIPLQVASALLYQLTHRPGDSAAARAVATIDDPGSFWSADRMATAILFLGTLLVIFAATRRELGAWSLFVPLAMLAYAPAWAYQIDLLGNESFALPLFFALWLALRRAISRGLRPTAFFVAGAAAGIPYLNKLNYIAWSLSAALAVTYYAWRADASAREKARALGAFLAGAVIAVVAIGVAFLGPDGFRFMLETHLQVLLKTGHFGLGDPGVVKPALALQNLRSFVGQYRAFSAWLAALLVLIVALRPWRSRDGGGGRESLNGEHAMLLFLGSAFVLVFLAAMKHYFPRYIVPALVVVPFAVLTIRGRLTPVAAAALLACTVALDVHAASAERDRVRTEASVIQGLDAEAQRVRKLIPNPGWLRIWTYKVLAPEYSFSFLVDISGHPEIYRDVYGRRFLYDFGVFRDLPRDSSWQYVVYTRHEFLSHPELAVAPGLEVAFEGQYLVVLRRNGA